MKKCFALLLAFLMLLTLCACGKQAPRAADTVSAAAPGYAYDYDYEYAAEENAMFSMAAPEAANGGLAVSGSAARAASSNSGSDESAPEENPEKIIYSANVTVETTAFDASLQQLNALVERFGGWVESSSINGANYYDISRGRSNARSAGYTLRIPSANFDALMNELSTLGNVPYSHVYTENVTAQYYDVQAHLTAYETQEARLLELMEKAETVEDIITIEARLSELRYQIESLQGTLRNWDRRVSYSTVYLQLNEVREYTPDTPVVLSFGERLSRAFSGGLEAVDDFFRDALLWLVEALPTLVLLAAVAAVVVVLIRRGVRKRRAKKQAAMSKPE